MSQEIPRRRRVRFAYPQDAVDFVLSIVPLIGVSAIARSADIPPSVIYRWREFALRKGDLPTAVEPSKIFQLMEQCSRTGCSFYKLYEDVRSRIGASPQAPSSVHAADEQGRGEAGEKKSRDVPAQMSSNRNESGAEVSLDLSRRNDRPRYDITADAMHRLLAAKRAIEENYFDSISCACLADVARMSRTYFIRMFGAAFGTTPHQYLLRVRLAAAKELLTQSYESIDVVAAAVGFRTGANLGRAFKQIQGKPVSQAFVFTILSKQAVSAECC